MRTLFTDNWLFGEFEPNTAYENMATSPLLKEVDIPHDWMIWHTDDLYKNSIGFYKKTFRLAPCENHRYFVVFDGVYMDSRIYLNDNLIFEWKYGYSSFEVELTPYLKAGENSLCVSCNYQAPNSRWYSGAGIYRNVFFIDKNCTYIAENGVYLSTEKSGKNFFVHIDTEIQSPCTQQLSIKHKVFDSDNSVVATSEISASVPGGLSTDRQTFIVEKPILWDIDNPYLYHIESQLLLDGIVIDNEINTLGFRTIEFDCNKGFFLNGRNVKINGVCQHHDLGALGSAMNKVALKRQFSKLIEMGVNSIRTSHNMPAREVMELADEMGLLIYSESFDMWELPKTTFDYGNYFPTWWDKDVKSWVRRDRNHPSLIIWGIGNEIYDTHAGNGLKWTIALRDEIKRHDYFHNAYIGIGSNYIEWENAQKCSNELELSGYNYGERLYDAHHKKYPAWCIFGSETSSTVQSRGIYHFPLETRLLTYEDGQCSCLGNCTTNWGAKDVDTVVFNHRDRDFVFGQYLWSGWDYIGEPTPYFSKNSFFGQIDTAGFEKDTFYHYQAEWTDMKKNPMVHLLPYWDFNEGQIIDVCAYSNAPEIELFLNGASLGRQSIDHLHGQNLKCHWKVAYIPGTLEAKAYDESGNVVATDIQKSFTDPVAISLKADKDLLFADGEDLAFIEITTVDKDGTFVANAKNRINVSVTGTARLVGLDNGDSTDYDEYKGSSRKLFSGKLLAIIASTEKVGTAKVTVSSEGLISSEIQLSFVSSPEKKEVPCKQKSFESPQNHEIPIRKIELKNLGKSHLNQDCTETDIAFEICPKNASYKDLRFKALTKDGVGANFVKITVNNNIAHITALGDGEFRFTALANNGKDLAEIISELELSVSGLGKATFNPYEMIPGCQYSDSHSDECKLSFEGGVFLPNPINGVAYVTYDNVDFGEFGSDEITIPIFSFRDELELEVWEGSYGSGEKLFKGTYSAKTRYNHYQENTFKLSKRIKGTSSVTLAFFLNERISVKGFRFTKLNKAYSQIEALDNSLITGDSFTYSSDAVTSIGNNVTLEFDNMNFTEGLSAIKLCGRSNNALTSVHILFSEGDYSDRQMIEIPYSESYNEYEFPLSNQKICGKVYLVFLPGSNFDLKWFKFVPAK